jgi:hypothetical protein
MTNAVHDIPNAILAAVSGGQNRYNIVTQGPNAASPQITGAPSAYGPAWNDQGLSKGQRAGALEAAGGGAGTGPMLDLASFGGT